MDRGFHTASARHELQFVPPMLLGRVPRLPEGEDWLYEVKWDGYRMQAVKDGGNICLFSRNGADYTSRFPKVVQAVAQLKPATLHLDGELVALDPSGRPSFQALQGGLPLPPGCQIGFYAFDLLRYAGESLMRTALIERRAHLHDALAGSGIRFSPALEGTAEQVIQAVREHGLEGVVAKRKKSLYEAGKRSGAWVKLPSKQAGEFVVGGFRPAGESFSVLLVGKLERGRLQFAGKVRHGFNPAGRSQVWNALQPLRTRGCPFVNLPNVKADPFDENVTPEEMESFVWLRPELKVPIRYAEWTRMRTLRHAEHAA